jgi:hypothetical protein
VSVRRTELSIEHLVLDGVRPAHARVVGEAIERELARLVREHGTPDAPPLATDDLAISIEGRGGESPSALGARVANAIYERMHR